MKSLIKALFIWLVIFICLAFGFKSKNEPIYIKIEPTDSSYIISVHKPVDMDECEIKEILDDYFDCLNSKKI